MKDLAPRAWLRGIRRTQAQTRQAASHIEGDVFHRSLAIEQGAYFEGKSRRTDDPMSVQLRSTNGMTLPTN
jgi:cytoskeletal protein CcmA (bactofilin family)